MRFRPTFVASKAAAAAAAAASAWLELNTGADACVGKRLVNDADPDDEASAVGIDAPDKSCMLPNPPLTPEVPPPLAPLPRPLA